MDAETNADEGVAAIAAAIGEPARTRMLYCLMDGQARTSTELAMVAEVAPSTASLHLARLQAEKLVRVAVQGRYRYYSLAGRRVARALEGLSVLAGRARPQFRPTTPVALREARTCYDHMAGAAAVLLRERMAKLGWLREERSGRTYELTAEGSRGLGALGVDVSAVRERRRRFATACLDWSERRPHVGGALGAALLELALRRRWVSREGDSRALRITAAGRREMPGVSDS